MNDAKFSNDGNEYRTAEVPDGCCLVWRQVVSDDDEAYDGELLLVNKSALHDSPPRRKLDSKIAELDATRKDLCVQIGALRKELKDFENVADVRMVKLKQYKSLARLEDYLAGRITHYVESTTYAPPKILALEDTRADEGNGRYNKLKLLTLFGRADGDLEWGLNRYSDGSGCYTTVVPCTSYSEAREVAGELFATHDAKATDPEERTSPQSAWVTRAQEYGIQMSGNYRRQLQEQQGARRQEQIAKIESQLRDLKGQAK